MDLTRKVFILIGVAVFVGFGAGWIWGVSVATLTGTLLCLPEPYRSYVFNREPPVGE